MHKRFTLLRHRTANASALMALIAAGWFGRSSYFCTTPLATGYQSSGFVSRVL